MEPRTHTTNYAYEDEDPATPLANDGLLRRVTDALGHTSRFSYDERGNVLSVTDPLWRTTTNAYYPNSTLLHTSTDALGNVTTLTYNARGQMDTETRTIDGTSSPFDHYKLVVHRIAAGISRCFAFRSGHEMDDGSNRGCIADARFCRGADGCVLDARKDSR